jgi:Zn-finger nucleic acid-binding protein
MQPLQCPKCKAPMEQVQVETTEVDRCTSCRGLWFDALEDQDIRGAEGAETLDAATPGAPPASPPAKRRQSAIDCPRCKSPMIQMVDRMGRRIQYESCPRCHGKFLDAGEFKALEPRGVKATMRRLLKGKQRNS